MNLSEYWKGKKRPQISDEHRKKLSASHIGQVAWNKGKKMNDEFCKKISVRQLGRKQIRSDAGKKSFSEKMSGENHPRWVKDRTKRLERLRLGASENWKNWRKAVFERDGYKCLDCGTGGYLEPHHIIPLKQTLSRAFDVTNGISLCRPCHKMTMGKELKLARTYFSLIPAQVSPR